jgi:hypothetical protein
VTRLSIKAQLRQCPVNTSKAVLMSGQLT